MRQVFYFSSLVIYILIALTSCSKEEDYKNNTIHILQDKNNPYLVSELNVCTFIDNQVIINSDFGEYIEIEGYCGNTFSNGLNFEYRTHSINLNTTQYSNKIRLLKGETASTLVIQNYLLNTIKLDDNVPISQQQGIWTHDIELASIRHKFDNSSVFSEYLSTAINYPFVNDYIGIQINRNDSTYYGWIEINFVDGFNSYNGLNIEDYGYNFGYQITKIAIQTDTSKTILPGQIE